MQNTETIKRTLELAIYESEAEARGIPQHTRIIGEDLTGAENICREWGVPASCIEVTEIDTNTETGEECRDSQCNLQEYADLCGEDASGWGV